MVVAQRVTDVVPRPLITLWNLAAHLHLWRWCDIPAKASNEGVVQNVTQQAIEIAGAAALEERRVWGDLTCAAIVTGVGDAETVSWGLALWPSKSRRAQAAWTEVA